MGFLSPWYLLGALAVAVPIYVHLIRQERARPRPFASLMFFRRIPQRTVQRRRLRYLLLLAARCLLILLIALAFARPYLRRATSPTAAAGARLHVVLLDRSLSMRAAGRAERASAEARRILSRASGADKTSLIVFDTDATVLQPPTSDRAAALALLDAADVRPGTLGTNFTTALHALERTAQASDLPVSAFLISDFQKSGAAPGWTAPRLPPGTSLELISVDQTQPENWAVSELAISRDTFQRIYPGRLQVRVSAFGAPAAKKEVVLSLNGREVDRRSVDLAANGAATVVFENFELPPGASRGAIRLLPADGLPEDDVRYFSLVRREPYPVVYLAGADSRREPLYLTAALSAGHDPMFRLESRPIDVAGSEALESYAAVVLSNAGALSARAGARLREYVEKGGGIFLILGDRSDWPALSRALGGLLPAPEGEKTYVRRDAEQFITLGDFRREHFIFAPFSDTAAGGLMAARFFGYFRVRGAADSAVIARFSNGDPALLAHSVGAGRVLVLASSLDNLWNDLPLRAGFVPLVSQAVRFLSGMREEPAAHVVPARVALDRVWGPREQPDSWSVLDPNGRRQEGDEAGKAAVTQAHLTEPGFYEVRHSRKTDYIAGNTDPRESDLAALAPEDRALLAPAPAGSPAAASGSNAEQRRNFWWTLLLLAALAAAAESILGNRHLRATRAPVLAADAAAAGTASSGTAGEVR